MTQNFSQMSVINCVNCVKVVGWAVFLKKLSRSRNSMYAILLHGMGKLFPTKLCTASENIGSLASCLPPREE